MLNGYVRLADMLAVMGGFDASKKENRFKIIIREPISYKRDVIELYTDTFTKIGELIEKYKDLLNKDTIIKMEAIKRLCGMFGIPEQITEMFLEIFKDGINVKDLRAAKDLEIERSSIVESGNNHWIYELQNHARVSALLNESLIFNTERRESLEKLGFLSIEKRYA
jgi:hypothetical protein